MESIDDLTSASSAESRLAAARRVGSIIVLGIDRSIAESARRLLRLYDLTE